MSTDSNEMIISALLFLFAFRFREECGVYFVNLNTKNCLFRRKTNRSVDLSMTHDY